MPLAISSKVGSVLSFSSSSSRHHARISFHAHMWTTKMMEAGGSSTYKIWKDERNYNIGGVSNT